jgi:hypothetical protein
MFRIGVVGSRTYPNIPEVWETLTLEQKATNIKIAKTIIGEFLDALPPLTHVVSGGAKGVDTWAVELAKERGLPWTIHKADWDRHGRSAGFKRNLVLLSDVDAVAVFWNKQSKGTQHTIKNAVKQRIPTVVFGPDGLELFRMDENDAVLLAAQDRERMALPKEVKH